MDKRYKSKGLTVVGGESQNSSPEAINKVVDDLKIKFAVTKGVRGPRLSDGLPYAAVFDTAAFWVVAAKIETFDTRNANSLCAHRARLHRDIEVALR